MDSNFSEQKVSTLRELCGQAGIIKSLVDEYLSRFNGDGILKLFSNEADKKKYIDRYDSFTAKLFGAISALEDTVAKISRLIGKADECCDNENTALLCQVFKESEALLSTVSGFFACNGKNFSSKEDFKPSIALSSARELKTAVDIFEKSQKEKTDMQ